MAITCTIIPQTFTIRDERKGLTVFKTIRQVARYLEIPESLVRRLVAQGLCPGLYSGNRFLVNVDGLKQYLDAQGR